VVVEAETVESAVHAAKPSGRRGRPAGSKDKQPRKRRNDGIVGQVLEAAAVPTPAAAPKPATPPKTPSQLPLTAAPSPSTPAAESETAAIPPEALGDLRRKLKFEADIKEEQAKKFARENAVAAGRLRPAEEFDAMLARRASVLARSMLALPDRISDELALESDPRRIRVRLRGELEALLRTYSGQAAQASTPPASIAADDAQPVEAAED
jgi:hypothetical protein